jgi:hypothetical protein
MNAFPVCFAPDVRANLRLGVQWELPTWAEIGNVLWPRALTGSWGHIASQHDLTLILSRDRGSRDSGMKCMYVCTCADCDRDDADNAV